MKYVTPYSYITKMAGTRPSKSNGDARHSSAFITEDVLVDIIKLLLQSVDVDEDWYRLKYPDVADAIDEGVFRSAKHHFIESGYFEGRLPAELTVNEEWYAATYEDVAERVKSGAITSLTQHFRDHGYDEGRRPFAI